jgi:predicted TIM-barrel fold metal-dependent hydrolase
MKIFDTHLHIIDKRFSLIPNQGYLPDYFSCKDYLESVNSLNVVGGAIVSGSFQGFDQSYLYEGTIPIKFLSIKREWIRIVF